MALTDTLNQHPHLKLGLKEKVHILPLGEAFRLLKMRFGSGTDGWCQVKLQRETLNGAAGRRRDHGREVLARI